MAGSAFYYIFKDTKRDQVNEITYTTKVIQSYYELSFHQWELSLLSVGNRLIQIEDPTERLVYANRALEVYKNELLAFGFADTTGRVLTFTGRLVNDSLPNLKRSERTRRSFELTLQREGISLGENYYFENVSDWVLPIRVPIKNDRDEIIAVNTSAIDYSSMVRELEAFGFDENYRIQLKNNDFNTTQLYYPLARSQYAQVLGADTINYSNLDTVGVFDGIHLLVGKNPFTREDDMLACINISPVNHRLIVAVPGSVVYASIFERFKIVFFVYGILFISSFILYLYLRSNLKKSLSKVQTERANLKSIFESTSSVIGLFDRNKQLLEFNSSFNNYSILTDDLPLRKNMDLLAEIKQRESAALFSKFMDRALSGEKFQETITYPGPEGELTFRFTYNPVYHENRIEGFAFFAEDITEIKSYQKRLEEYSKGLEEKVDTRTKELASKNRELQRGYERLEETQQQLIRAEKMASLGILSAGIGHEINNPLNFIKHGAGALKQQLKTEHGIEDYEQFFEVIDEGVRRAATIVMGLSHFSRAGESMEESCDLHQILDNSLALLVSPLKTKEIEVLKSYKAEPYTVKGNAGKLHQVFTNIIQNAEQAIAQKGVISISSSNFEGGVLIEISDSGIGMSKSVLRKMTDPFFTTKSPGEGTGLGLFICQMIMDEHEAEMEVTSEKGKGTKFRLSFKGGSGEG